MDPLSDKVFGGIPLSKIVLYLNARDLSHLSIACTTTHKAVHHEWSRRESDPQWRKKSYIGGLIGVYNGNIKKEDDETMMTTKEREIQYAKAELYAEQMEEQAYLHSGEFQPCSNCEDFPKLYKKQNMKEHFVRLSRWRQQQQNIGEEQEYGEICWQGFKPKPAINNDDGHDIPEVASDAILSSLPEVQMIIHEMEKRWNSLDNSHNEHDYDFHSNYYYSANDDDDDDDDDSSSSPLQEYSSKLTRDYIALTVVAFDHRQKLQLVVATHLPVDFSIYREEHYTVAGGEEHQYVLEFDPCFVDPHDRSGTNSEFIRDASIVVSKPTCTIKDNIVHDGEEGEKQIENNIGSTDHNSIRIKHFRHWRRWSDGYFHTEIRDEDEYFEQMEDDVLNQLDTGSIRHSRRRTPRRYPRKNRRFTSRKR